MGEEILCDNCEVVLTAQDYLTGGVHLCVACKEIYEGFESDSFEEYMITRDWIQAINPLFDNPGKLLIRSVALLRAMWPEVPVKEWRLVKGYQVEGTVALRVDPIISVRLVISYDATSAMIAIENPIPKQPIIGCIKRMALRNADWLDIFGWVNSAKTWYDRRDTEKLKQCIKEGIVREEYLLSNPLNPPKSEYMKDKETGVVVRGRQTKLKYMDNQGEELSVEETASLISKGETQIHVEYLETTQFKDVGLNPVVIKENK